MVTAYFIKAISFTCVYRAGISLPEPDVCPGDIKAMHLQTY